MEFLGLCKWCGCPLYRDGPVEWHDVWCSHEIQTEMDEEVKHIEDSDEARSGPGWKVHNAVRRYRGW